jgi:hypothetical protein
MWLYYVGAVMILLAVWSIQRTQRLYIKYDAKLAELKDKTKNGYYPKAEIDQMVDSFIEEFKEENIDSIIYIQMADGIKTGAVDVVSVDDLVMMSTDEYDRLVKSDKLVDEMNRVAARKKLIN